MGKNCPNLPKFAKNGYKQPNTENMVILGYTILAFGYFFKQYFVTLEEKVVLE